MARRYQPRPLSSASSEAHAQLLYDSLEKYNALQQKKNTPSVILVALIVLFLSSAGGISLAIVLMAKVKEIEAACIARDFILFAGLMSMLYICLHIYGARRDYTRQGLGPPQMYGQYLHASAMLVARLGIVIWIAALVATAIMIARSIPLAGFAGKVPFLDLLLCVGAIPSFLVISVTIEKNTKPFATASVSNPSFLNCRVSDFADDLSADSSVSRQSSLQQRQSQAGSGSVLTLPTEELLGLGARQQDEKKINQFTEKTHEAPPKIDITPSLPAQPKPQTPGPTTTTTQAVPEPTYCPGGWSAEWNSVAQEAGVSRSTDSSSDGSSNSDSSSTPLVPASTRLPSSSPKLPQIPTPIIPSRKSSTTTTNTLPQQHRYSYNRSTARLSGTPSNLSTVRYASEPEIAVQQSIRVFRNPAYRPRSGSVGTNECQGVQRPDIALLRNAQQAQKTEDATPVPKRTPSNFSRPMPKTADTNEKVGTTETDKGSDVKIPGTFVEDAGDDDR
ncbi:hypothetical protein F5B22DRAFT_646712 [Xylaria bambusicola]|uniref:uncharacterized protein n=1 Tax=Xylaria bambusicola TaxID=326684 RepID=UPI002008E742|nr:uncharacterized protein F5B22DRAFT_646712 [Xylaria bambusicola]KAI0515438.1 hypothetical protein F5B22DRAFT_646712 [Xylaria bambusicola]